MHLSHWANWATFRGHLELETAVPEIRRLASDPALAPFAEDAMDDIRAAEMINFLLPEQLTDGAVLRDKEYAWELSAFPRALENASGLGYACLGGQFWFLSQDDSLYEPFWLEANAADRADGEQWADYAQRSCAEVLAQFNSLLETTSFVEDAKKFSTFAESLSLDDFKAKFRVLFNAYFVTEDDLQSLLRR